MNVPPDFACEPAVKGKLHYTHRRTDDGLELYFVANRIDGVVAGSLRLPRRRRATGVVAAANRANRAHRRVRTGPKASRECRCG